MASAITIMRLVCRTVYPLDVGSTPFSETIESNLLRVVLVLFVVAVVVLLMSNDVALSLVLGLALGASLIEGAREGQARGGLVMTGTILLLRLLRLLRLLLLLLSLLLLPLLPLLCFPLLDLLEDRAKDCHHEEPFE